MKEHRERVNKIRKALETARALYRDAVPYIETSLYEEEYALWRLEAM